jgi:hypothetical protein
MYKNIDKRKQIEPKIQNTTFQIIDN